MPDATQAASRAGTITVDFIEPDALHREQLRSLSAEPAVSASATAHPVEDWAERFARELLLVDAGRPAR